MCSNFYLYLRGDSGLLTRFSNIVRFWIQDWLVTNMLQDRLLRDKNVGVRLRTPDDYYEKPILDILALLLCTVYCYWHDKPGDRWRSSCKCIGKTITEITLKMIYKYLIHFRVYEALIFLKVKIKQIL